MWGTIIKLVIQLIGLVTVLIERSTKKDSIKPVCNGTIVPEDKESPGVVDIVEYLIDKESEIPYKYPDSKSINELVEYIKSSHITRHIKKIVFHCTGTSYAVSVEGILNYWKNELGWRNPGYHIIIKPDGNWVVLLDFNLIANGVKGHNANHIHISTIGGLNKNYPLTLEQEAVLFHIHRAFSEKIPNAKFKGHNEFTDLKDCPGYYVPDLITEFEYYS